MTKYQFVLHSAECQNFIDRLRELGMVDITTSGYEPSERDRELILSIEARAKAEQWLSDFMHGNGYDKSQHPFATGEEAFECYQMLNKQLAGYNSELDQLEKARLDAMPWGEFNSETISKLKDQGVELNLFVAKPDAYDQIVASGELCVEKISLDVNSVYFVVVTRSSEPQEIDIDAMAIKPLRYSVSEAEAQMERIEGEIESLDGAFSRVAKSLSLIAANRAELTESLQINKISSTAEDAADGRLLVLEGWAEQQRTKDVDAALEVQTGLVYFKNDPTPEDNTPVKLQNNWYVRLFELIGDLYAKPKYGTIDLTPFFAPFYMLFFAVCLCDAGYGAIIAGAGLYMYMKGGEKLRQAAYLSLVCGVAAIIFGVLCNSFFGLEIGALPMVIDFQQSFFNISMVLGVIHVLLAMVIKLYVTTRRFGFKYALDIFGWLMIIVSSIVASAGIESFNFDSIAYQAIVGVGGVLLICFHTPDKNPLANIGGGIWGLYNRMTALLGDVLSYIRLFAIGLSGGILAIVFNSFAMGITGLDGDLSGEGFVSIALKIVGAALILLIGHGINLFMSTISSLVHPMRLTFVEFYGNAGFEISMRKFEPLKKE
ncbi:MAG: V-type ATP synthase subunit I [Rikenellaceae bacterium]